MPLTRRPIKRKPLLRKPAGPLPEVLRARLQRVRQQQAWGVGFAARLTTRPAQPLTPGARVAVVVAALGALLALLGALQRSAPLAVVGTCVGATGALAGLWLRRARRAGPMPAVRWWDAQAVSQLDALLQARAGELPAAAVAVLDEIKAALSRMAPQLQTAQAALPGPPFRADDLFFLAELLRRYVPESLQAYWQVPAAQRGSALLPAPDGGGRVSAEGLLCTQLSGLRDQVHEREQRLAQSCAQALMQQDRFLRAKQRSGS